MSKMSSLLSIFQRVRAWALQHPTHSLPILVWEVVHDTPDAAVYWDAYLYANDAAARRATRLDTLGVIDAAIADLSVQYDELEVTLT